MAAAFVLFVVAARRSSLLRAEAAAEDRAASRPTWSTVVAGFRYVWHEKIVLGAISLDLFAVLLGGAIALLPAYARDILDVGPWGLGLLRSARRRSARSPMAALSRRPAGHATTPG